MQGRHTVAAGRRPALGRDERQETKHGDGDGDGGPPGVRVRWKEARGQDRATRSNSG